VDAKLLKNIEMAQFHNKINYAAKPYCFFSTYLTVIKSIIQGSSKFQKAFLIFTPSKKPDAYFHFKMKQQKTSIKIKNKKALHFYHILETKTAGIQLIGLDIKLIRMGKVGISESYGHFINSELYISNMHLAERENDRLVMPKNKTMRKLLMKRNELNKWEKKVCEKGISMVPLTLFFNDEGRVKVEIALVKGKREFDKRQTLKTAENMREIDRIKKAFKR
jgi:SsrA-binding protein